MDRLSWLQLVAAAIALGCPNSAWGADSVGPLVIVAGTLALVTVCLVGAFVCVFVGLALGWQWGTDDAKTRKGVSPGHARQETSEADDPRRSRPR